MRWKSTAGASVLKRVGVVAPDGVLDEAVAPDPLEADRVGRGGDEGLTRGRRA